MALHPERIERLLNARNARLALVALAVLSVVFALALRDLRLDHDFERFFPTDDPELDRYQAFRERFGGDNDLLFVAAPHRPSVFRREFLLQVDGLALGLAALPDVRSVTSPTSLTDPRVTPAGVFNVPWLRLDHDSTLAADSARVWRDGRIREAFFAPDGGALLLVLLTEPGLDKERSDVLMERVREEVEASGLEGVRMGGRIHGQYWYIQKMRRELAVFFPVSVAVVALFLAIGFRRVWGVLVPVGVVGLTVMWQVGIMTLMDRPLGILTMLLPTILFVVGMSDVVHILERYIAALRDGHTKARAMAIAYHEVGLATFLTSLTTAIGFATLLTSGIGPIREFGAFTAAGVFLAFLLSFTLLPAVLLLLGTPLMARTEERMSFWYPFMHGLFRKVLHHRRRLPWAFAGLTVASLVLMARLKVDNQLLEDWPDDDPQKLEYLWFEERFGGVRPFEMEIVAADSGVSVWDLSALRDIETVQTHLESDYGVRAVLSPVTVVKSLNQAFNGGGGEFFRLPNDEAETRRLVKRAGVFAGGTGTGALVGADGRRARLSGRMRDEGGHAHMRKNAVLEARIEEGTGAGRLVFHQTGMAYLIDRNNARLSGQLIGGLSIAFLLIAAIMARVFRDWRMTFIALVPNTLPLLFVGGLMGAVGIDVKVSTAIIFTIAFGIAVDDTIHMLGRLRIELNRGLSLPYALKRSFLSAGKALVITSVLLLGGFLPLVLSGFASVFYMGLLTSATLLMALAADLLLLPLLVLRFLDRR